VIRKILFLLHRLSYKVLDIKALYYSYLFKRCGNNFKIWGNCNIKNPQNIKIGNNVSLNDGCYLNGLGEIEIGNDVAISANSIVVSTSLDPNTLKHKKEHINKKIVIGNNVQIGAGAIILAGVKIGDNVLVGAGTTVTKNIESNCIVVGNPAKILRKLD
jgi:maltose O-acetyltransferase